MNKIVTFVFATILLFSAASFADGWTSSYVPSQVYTTLTNDGNVVCVVTLNSSQYTFLINDQTSTWPNMIEDAITHGKGVQLFIWGTITAYALSSNLFPTSLIAGIAVNN